jgi:ABC-type glycerol-3-phosphate transport system substrate-binding protein
MIGRRGISRRAFLHVAVAVSGATLVACATPFVQAPPSAPTQTGRKTLKLDIQSFAHAGLRPVLDTWTARTGHAVELVSGPPTDEEVIARYTSAFRAGTSPADVISVSDGSGPGFYRAGWIEPLDDVIPQATWDDFPRLFNSQIEVWHSYQGRRYRVPHEFGMSYFWYRKDWFDRQNMTPPKTWDEFVEIGKQFTQGSVSGTLEGLKRNGLVWVFMAYLTTQAGGEVFSFDEPTAVAFEFAYNLIHTHKILPERAIDIDYGQQNEAYMQDKVAMMRQWPFFWDVSRGNASWYAPGKAEIALPPAGPAGAKNFWGGWGFSVPKYAPNKAEALDLIRWITSNDNAPLLAKGQSWFIMPRKSILAALGDYGLIPAMKMYIENDVPVVRRFHEKVYDAALIVDDVGYQYLTKKLSLDEAMRRGRERISALSAKP